MRKAIIYASVHHGNTEKLVKSIAEECQVDLIDAVKQSDADLSSYDMIGFAFFPSASFCRPCRRVSFVSGIRWATAPRTS